MGDPKSAGERRVNGGNVPMRACFIDQTVQRMSNSGCDMAAIVDALAAEKQELIARLTLGPAAPTVVVERAREILPGMAGMVEIAHEIRTQDNLATAHPAFCVQVLRRYGPVDLRSGGPYPVAYYDLEEGNVYYQDVDIEEWERLRKADALDELPPTVTSGGYLEAWESVTVCLTRKGCEGYLKANQHNISEGAFGVRVFVDSFHRNNEMIAIRNFLKSLHP